MMIKCIHTGDLHLGMEFKNASFNTEQGQRRRRELWETFYRIVDRAIVNKVDLLLIAGDLFEEDNFDIGDIKRIESKFREAKNVRIVIATGNHDPLVKRSLYSLIKWPDNVYIFESDNIEKLEFDDINTVVWGLSWKKKIERRNLLDNIDIENRKKINILLVHGDILNNQSDYLPIDKQLIQDIGFDYIALGHIHKQIFINERIAYCGSPEPLDFGELGPHGIIEGNISKEKADMKFIPFSKRTFIIKEIEVKPDMSYQDIINSITQIDDIDNRKKNLYRIYLKGIRDDDINMDIEDLRDMINDRFYYVEMFDETAPDYDLEKLRRENENNIIGNFIKEMEEKGLANPVVKDALYLGLKALLKEKVKL